MRPDLVRAMVVSSEELGVAQGPVTVPRSPLISLRDVAVAYEDERRPVVSGATLDVFEGEALLVMGPSGCGKSTLAMLAAGLIPGVVEASVTGHVWRAPGLEIPGAVGYVFQDPESQLTLLETGDEIAFGLENAAVPRSSMPPLIAAALAGAGLQVGVRDRHLTFSGGMKQKLALACALAMDARMIILDEPTAYLDPKSTREVVAQVRALRESGRTLLIIEHKYDLLLPFVDRVALLERGGQLRCVGTPAEVLRDEWEWMVAEGVVPAWRARPGVSGVSARAEAGAEASADGTWAAGGGRIRSLPILELEHASLQYGDHLVWQGVSVQAFAGELIAVVGPNGAGKTSLLEALIGMERLREGTAKFAGRALRSWRRRALFGRVALCFQNPEFQFLYHTVADEIANKTLGDAPLSEAGRQLLREFGLSGLESQSPFGLSLGQKRRLSVAVMVREQRDVYLLDEPTFGQDNGAALLIMERLVGLCRAGKTVILSTHDMDLVKRYATEVWVVADGTVLYAGKAAELWEHDDILWRAHLEDDVRAVRSVPSGYRVGTQGTQGTGESVAGVDVESIGAGHRVAPMRPTLVHPSWHLIAVCLCILIGIFAHTVTQAALLFALPIVLMLTVARLSPWRVIKRLSPFVGVYVLWIWSFASFAQAPPGSPELHILWMHPSLAGFQDGLVLAFRMLSAVAFSALFVLVTDVTDLIVSLCTSLRASPRFAYGILAGIRFLPLFKSEWQKLRRARQLRGRDAGWAVLRPVVYALPLLTQAIRMSERVAIAMEARGFHGDVAHDRRARTFYREVRVRPGDVIYTFLILSVSLLIVLRA